MKNTFKKIAIALMSIVLITQACKKEKEVEEIQEVSFQNIKSESGEQLVLENTLLDELSPLTVNVLENSVLALWLNQGKVYAYQCTNTNGIYNSSIEVISILSGLQIYTETFSIDENLQDYRLYTRNLIKEKVNMSPPSITYSQLINLNFNLNSSVEEFAKKFFKKINVDSRTNHLFNSIFFHDAIIKARIRKGEAPDCECTTQTGYLTEGVRFTCSEDMLFEKTDIINFYDNTGMTEQEKNDLGISSVITYINNSNKTIFSYREVNDVIINQLFPNAIDGREINSGAALGGCAKGLQGSDLGCCGNYSGRCYYCNILCFYHDLSCLNCEDYWRCGGPFCNPEE